MPISEDVKSETRNTRKIKSKEQYMKEHSQQTIDCIRSTQRIIENKRSIHERADSLRSFNNVINVPDEKQRVQMEYEPDEKQGTLLDEVKRAVAHDMQRLHAAGEHGGDVAPCPSTDSVGVWLSTVGWSQYSAGGVLKEGQSSVFCVLMREMYYDYIYFCKRNAISAISTDRQFSRSLQEKGFKIVYKRDGACVLLPLGTKENFKPYKKMK